MSQGYPERPDLVWNSVTTQERDGAVRHILVPGSKRLTRNPAFW